MIYGQKSKRAVAWAAMLLVAGAGIALGQGKKSSPPVSPSTWVSRTTHHVYRLEMKGNTLVAQWVDVPPMDARHGAYVRSELHRVGGKWVGTTRSLLPCVSGPPAAKQTVHWCPFLTHIEILTLSPSRITGRAQAAVKGDCEPCKLLETRWVDFDWYRPK